MEDKMRRNVLNARMFEAAVAMLHAYERSGSTTNCKVVAVMAHFNMTDSGAAAVVRKYDFMYAPFAHSFHNN